MTGRLLSFLAMFAIALSSALADGKTTAVWNDGHTSSLSDEELIRNALASPGPAYPEEAQKAKLSGDGIYELQIKKDGTAASVRIIKSSGSDVLDRAATTTFKRWRFKPGIFTSVRIPVSWSAHPVSPR